jgi:hypothetical protein
LRLPGARVIDVSFTAEGVVVEVALRRRRTACSCCGQLVRAVHDRTSRRWRHLDLAGQRSFRSPERSALIPAGQSVLHAGAFDSTVPLS